MYSYLLKQNIWRLICQLLGGKLFVLPGPVHPERLPIGRHLAAQRTGHAAVADMPALNMVDHGVLDPRGEGTVGAAVSPAPAKPQHHRLDDGVNFFKLSPLQF